MPACLATASKVTGSPAASGERSAWMALERVYSLRRGRPRRCAGCCRLASAVVSGSSGSASSGVMICSRLPRTCWFISTTRAWPRASAAETICSNCWRCSRCCGRNSGVGDEYRAGQEGVGVRTGLPHRQAALAIGQGLGRAAEPLLGPGGLGRRPGRVEGDALALDVDLAGPFPVRADRGVVQPGVVRGHLALGLLEVFMPRRSPGEITMQLPQRRTRHRRAPVIRGLPTSTNRQIAVFERGHGLPAGEVVLLFRRRNTSARRPRGDLEPFHERWPASSPSADGPPSPAVYA